MPDAVVIRSCVESDLGSFHAYIDAVARERRFFAMVVAPPLDKLRENVAKRLGDGMPHIMAMAGERVVGHADLTAQEREGFRHNALLGMGLLPEYRGRGLGARLLEHVIEGGRLAGIQRVELGVYASNAAAIALYEKSDSSAKGCRRKRAGSTAAMTTSF